MFLLELLCYDEPQAIVWGRTHESQSFPYSSILNSFQSKHMLPVHSRKTERAILQHETRNALMQKPLIKARYRLKIQSLQTSFLNISSLRLPLKAGIKRYSQLLEPHLLRQQSATNPDLDRWLHVTDGSIPASPSS
jgi:hypothetical protein